MTSTVPRPNRPLAPDEAMLEVIKSALEQVTANAATPARRAGATSWRFSGRHFARQPVLTRDRPDPR